MALSNMKVFSDFAYAALSETVDQEVEKFNAASGGTILLQSAANVGDYKHEASFALISGLVRRRNAYGSGALTPQALAQLQHTSVKIAGGTIPVTFEPQQFEWIQRAPDEAGTVYGTQLAKGVMQDKLNSAIGALRAALLNNTAVAHDATAATLTLNGLNKGAAKFGDRSGELAAWVIHSKVMHDVFDAALTNANQLFTFGTVNVMQDGFGRRYVVTDSPALFGDEAGGAGIDHYYSLGLVPGAALVEDNGDFYTSVVESNGEENIKRTMQSEWSYNLGLKGYSWDTANGGKSPNDAAILTGTNWDKIATSNKDTAGVVVSSL